MRMTGGAALQPVSTAPSLPSLPGMPASPPRACRGGHTLKANGRPPSEDYPPSADARAPFLAEWDTAGCLDDSNEFSHAGTYFCRHGTTMTIQEPSWGEGLQFLWRLLILFVMSPFALLSVPGGEAGPRPAVEAVVVVRVASGSGSMVGRLLAPCPPSATSFPTRNLSPRHAARTVGTLVPCSQSTLALSILP